MNVILDKYKTHNEQINKGECESSLLIKWYEKFFIKKANMKHIINVNKTININETILNKSLLNRYNR